MEKVPVKGKKLLVNGKKCVKMEKSFGKRRKVAGK